VDVQPILDRQETGGLGQTGVSGGYASFELIPCRDGKARRIGSGIAALAHGLPRGVVPSCDPGAPGYANETSEARVMRLKGYGNSIVAPLAAMFIETCMEVIPHD
jgi:DNA (cytosine-5)-methyltransferase 1